MNIMHEDINILDYVHCHMTTSKCGINYFCTELWVVHTLHKSTVVHITDQLHYNTSSYSLMSPQQRTEESGKYVLLHAQYSVMAQLSSIA